MPLVALRDEPGSALGISVGRLVGVVAGLVVGVAVLAWVPLGVGALSLALAIALMLAIVLRTGAGMNVQVALSAVLVLANADPDSYAVTRLWETVVGAAVTVVLAPFLFPTNPARAFRRALTAAATDAAESLRVAADLWAGGAGDPADLVRQARDQDERARGLVPGLAAARRAVRLHPLWRRRHTGELAALEPAAAAATTVASLVRTHADDLAELRARPDTEGWRAEYGARTAESTRSVADAVTTVLVTGADAAIATLPARRTLGGLSADDTSRVGAVSRRPLVRILTVLQGPDAPLGPPATLR